MEVSMNEQKPIAVQFMQQLGVDKSCIAAFEKTGKIYCYEDFVATEIDPDSALGKKIKWFEETRQSLVYAVTHSYMLFGECYELLCVSPYSEDWDYIVRYSGRNSFWVNVYAWNVDDEDYSEMGSVNIINIDGGLGRIG